MNKVITDEQSGMFLATELKSMKAGVYGKEYPQLMARQVFPFDSTSDAGADSVAYECYDMVGAAKLLHSYSDNLPQVEVSAKEEIRKVKGAGVEFTYSVQDVRRAQMSGKPLNSRKMEAAQRSLRLLEDTIAFLGDEEHGIPSFLLNPNMNEVAPVAGAGGSTRWVEKTPDEILADTTRMQTVIIDNTNGVEAPQTLMMPFEQYAHIASTPRSAVSDTTILRFILDSAPYISDIVPCYRLKGAAGADAGYQGEDLAILYDRDPSKLWLETPSDVNFLEPEKHGLKYSVAGEMRTAGVIMPFPKSASRLKGC